MVFLNRSRYATRCMLLILAVACGMARAQAQGEARVTARISAAQIAVGDQVKLFLEAQNNPSAGRLQWANIPDSVNGLEIIEKGKIDTVTSGSFVTYRQRLIITGFDSGMFQVPSLVFSVFKPDGSAPLELRSDSFQLLVQTLAVDTTKAFKPIKGIIFVKTTWMDYLVYIIIGGLIVLVLAVIGVYLWKNKKPEPPKPPKPAEPLYDRTMRLLDELDAKQLWQKNKVKDYYVELTDIVRGYIEERFGTKAMELTTDELLTKVRHTKDLMAYYERLSMILTTADLAKFAKAQPLPQEHVDAMEHAKTFVNQTKPIIIQPTTETENKI
jgi:hypothetical protein